MFSLALCLVIDANAAKTTLTVEEMNKIPKSTRNMRDSSREGFFIDLANFTVNFIVNYCLSYSF